MTKKQKPKVRDWSRSSKGTSPAEAQAAAEAERVRRVVADGFRRVAAEKDYRDSLGSEVADELRAKREKP